MPRLRISRRIRLQEIGSIDSRTDADLVLGVQRHDTRALEELYDRHRVLAYSLALRMLGDARDAEDVVQEAFINVWRASQTYRPERSSARSWLLSIVHHRAIDKIRGRQSRVQAVTIDEQITIPDKTDVWREVSEKLTGEDIRGALDALPTEQRETLELAYFKGYTHSQIAQLMEVPLGTVKGRMRIGLHKLRSLLESGQAGMAAR